MIMQQSKQDMSKTDESSIIFVEGQCNYMWSWVSCAFTFIFICRKYHKSLQWWF